MALLMGLGGGITRDVLVGEVPGALTNPAYIVLALAFGTAGYLMAYKGGQLFREGIFQFMTSFSLPWYAIAGAQQGVEVGLPIAGVLILAVVGPTAGRWYVDVSCGVPPKQFVRGEWFVTIAALTGLIWLVAYELGASIALSAGIAFVIGFAVRVTALFGGWEEPLAKEPSGVYVHDDGRPLLGRKLKGKSKREMSDLGLVVHKDDEMEVDPKSEQPAGEALDDLIADRRPVSERRARSENRRCRPSCRACCPAGRPPGSAGSTRRGRGRTHPSGA